MSTDFAALDAEYLADAGEDPTAAPATLPPYFGLEEPGRDLVIAQQRRTIRDWISRNALFAAARREIVTRRNAAFAAEGLA